MKECLKRNRIIAVLILLGILAALIPIVSRVRAEEENKSYDLILSYNSLQSMVQQSEYDMDEWLDMFRGWGVDKLVLGELSVRKMSSNAMIPVFGGTVSEIRNSHAWQLRYPDEVSRWIEMTDNLFDALVIVEDTSSAEWVCNAFDERIPGISYRKYEENGVTYVFFQRQSNGLQGVDVLDLPIGIWPEMLEQAQEHGMQVIPRTEAVDKLNGEAFARSFLRILDESGSPYFLNMGDSLLGNDDPEGKKLLLEYLRTSDISIGAFEENDQSGNLVWDGYVALLEDTGYRGVRLFNEWPYIQNRYAYCGYEGPEEITNSFFRAIAERNCRIIYLNMILEPDNDVHVDADESKWTYITDPAEYEKMLGDLDVRLSQLGYTHRTVQAMTLETPNRIWHIIEGIGVVAAAVLLLDSLFVLPRRARIVLSALGIVCVLVLAVLKPHAYQLILSMGGGMVMPALAAVWLCRHTAKRRREEPKARFGRLLAEALGTLLIAAVLCLCGAVLSSSALSQMSYLLELDLYRGVKLMQLIPIAVFVFAYLLVYAYEESGAKAAVLKRIGKRGEKGRAPRFYAYWSELMNQPVKLGWLTGIFVVAVVLLFVFGAGVYYIYRTGNATNVSAGELRLRSMLENLLIARPRTKEMLIGWPCAMLFIWSLRRHMNFLPILFGGGMSIGLVSVVNTFLHIRTPFLLSLLRTGWGLLFGLLIGVVLTVVAELLLHLLRRWWAQAGRS